jgi:hypothetical protein
MWNGARPILIATATVKISLIETMLLIWVFMFMKTAENIIIIEPMA